MELRFVDLAHWESLAERRFAPTVPQYVLRDLLGTTTTVYPGMTLHRDLTILGADWIPFRADGTAAAQQMVHSPKLYLDKARNLERRDGAYHEVPASTRRINEDAVLVGGHPNYYHWIIDHLPRLLYAMEFGEISGRKILLNRELTPIQKESLDLLAFDADDWIHVDDDEAVQLRSVLVPNLLSNTTVVHPLTRTLLCQTFPPSPATGGRRIYLSREDAATRRLTNESELVSLLAQWGFERRLLSGMGFQAQIDLFAAAEAVVAVHGAGMANTIFCPPQARVFELFVPEHQVSSMYMLARVAGLKHVFVPAEVVEVGADGRHLLGTWRADLKVMEQALREHLGGP